MEYTPPPSYRHLPPPTSHPTALLDGYKLPMSLGPSHGPILFQIGRIHRNLAVGGEWLDTLR